MPMLSTVFSFLNLPFFVTGETVNYVDCAITPDCLAENQPPPFIRSVAFCEGRGCRDGLPHQPPLPSPVAGHLAVFLLGVYQTRVPPQALGDDTHGPASGERVADEARYPRPRAGPL